MVVCRSGGATRAQIPGWWKFFGKATASLSGGLPLYPGNPSLIRLIVPTPSRAKPWRRRWSLCSKKGAIELARLPSLGYYSRLFVGMKASGSWRPVIDLLLLNLKVLKTPFKMETLQSILLSVRRGDWMVSIDLKDAYLQVPMHPESKKVSLVHGGRQSLPIQGSLLWSVHGSAGLHAGHGSSFGDSPQSWNSASALSGRLADSGVLPRAGSSCSEDGPPVVQLSGDSRQLGEVSTCADSEDDVPRSPAGLCQFPGFSSPETSQQASLNWRRISVLRKSACEILARVAEGAVLSDSAHSEGTAADAVVPVCPSSGLGPLKSLSSCALISGDPSGSSLVVGPRAARARHLPRAGVSPARLVV